MEIISSILSDFGYPIAVTAALFWYMVTEQRALRSTLENNTIALTEIATVLKKHKDGEDNDD